MLDSKKQEEYLQLSSYIEKFATLNIKSSSNGLAPHKPVLLVSVIRLIDSGVIATNRIWPDDIIKDEFESNWRRYVPEDCVFKPWVWKPYWHLKTEGFWHFETIDSDCDAETIVPAGQTASIGKIRECIRFAYLDEALFDLLQYDANRQVLSRVLIETYLL